MDPATAPIIFLGFLVILLVGFVLYKEFHLHLIQKHLLLNSDQQGLLAMISSITDGIVLIDSEYHLVVYNPVVVPLLGITKLLQDPNAKVSFEDILIAIGTRINLKSSIDQAIASAAVIKLNEFELGTKVLQIDIEPVRDHAVSPIGVVIVIHDVTGQKQLEKLHDEFTAMMIHELRTPLTTVSYSTSMILTDIDKMEKSQIGEQIQIIKSTSAHLLSLVNDLLDVSKIEAGKFQIVKTPQDISKMIEEKMEVFKPLVEQKRLTLQSDIQPNLPAISFDQNRLGQVMDNLISNAIKYTEAGRVIISARLNNTNLEVSVTDSGDGVNPEDLPKLFSKFQQLGKGRTGQTKGTGLGLVIAKGIVEAHGGRIWATSAGAGQGTTFTFTLPVDPPSGSLNNA